MIIIEEYKKVLMSEKLDNLGILMALGDDAHRIKKAEEVSAVLNDLIELKKVMDSDKDKNADKAYIHICADKLNRIEDICTEGKCNEFMNFIAACLLDDVCHLKKMIDESIKVESEKLNKIVKPRYVPLSSIEDEEDDGDPYGVGNDSIFDHRMYRPSSEGTVPMFDNIEYKSSDK